MKLIKPDVEFISQEIGLEGIYKQIERCGRVCYKSEDRITDSSAEGFVDRMIKSNHTAMLEHGTIYLGKLWSGAVCHCCDQTKPDAFIDKYAMNPYSEVVVHNNDICVTTNYRVLVENDWLGDLQFMCNPTEYHLRRYTMKFTTDIGVCREILRHRRFSFANESTRYCDYGNTRFDGVTFIIPSWWEGTEEEFDELLFDMVNDGDISEQNIVWGTFFDALRAGEKAYMEALALGWRPEQARQMLPLATKTELIVTAFLEDWRHFFDLRFKGNTGRPHPDMQTIAAKALTLFVNEGIIAIDDY